MISRSKNLLLVVLALCTVVSAGYAEISGVLSGSLQSTGDDVVWTSTAPVTLGYGAYFADFNVTDFQVRMSQVDALGQIIPGTEVVGPFPPKAELSGAGLYYGAPFDIGNVVYDSNEMDFGLAVTVDDQGYTNISLTNVAFPELFDSTYQIQEVFIDFTLELTPVKKLWGDDFSSYSSEALLGDTAAWTTGWEVPDFSLINPSLQGSRTLKVGSAVAPGKAYMSDGYYGGFPDSWLEKLKTAIADGVPSHSIDGVATNDYIVTVKAYKRNSDAQRKGNYYLVARATDSAYPADANDIRFEVGWDAYSENFVALLTDSAGGFASDPENPDAVYIKTFAPIDITKPIVMTMRVKGSDVIGIAEHNGGKAVLRFTTNVNEAGDPGFGGEWQWGYLDIVWDDFAVYSVYEIAPTVCGDDGTIYLNGDINKDCRVDSQDLKLMASEWLFQD